MHNLIKTHNTRAGKLISQILAKPTGKSKRSLLFGLSVLLVLGACQVIPESPQTSTLETMVPERVTSSQNPELPTASPFPTRPNYSPGELVEYNAQTGDTLPVLAIRFNTTVEEILEANPIIPEDATTLPPGMPMQIPIYYQPFWGPTYQILPDSRFINGPSQIAFDLEKFISKQSGWLTAYSEYAAGDHRTGAQIVTLVAQNFSLSPQVLLTLLEYHARALSQDTISSFIDPDYLLGYPSKTHKGLYLQLVWAANFLNNGYYGWRTGHLTGLNLSDDTLERPDPWQNAATVALQYYFSQHYAVNEYRLAIGPNGYAQTFQDLFGDPWESNQPHIPGSLKQPELQLPFERGKTWAYTGGPHTGWGTGDPWAAIDFAPPSNNAGCFQSNEWNTAVADGVIARVDEGMVELDLDGDGDLRTGWVILYLHVATRDRVPLGTVLKAGQPLGHPSCEGGTSTGTHIHIARKYNGEWIPADGTLPLTLEGWVAHNGSEHYRGSLTRFSETIFANANATQDSYITSEVRSSE